MSKTSVGAYLNQPGAQARGHHRAGFHAFVQLPKLLAALVFFVSSLPLVITTTGQAQGLAVTAATASPATVTAAPAPATVPMPVVASSPMPAVSPAPSPTAVGKDPLITNALPTPPPVAAAPPNVVAYSYYCARAQAYYPVVSQCAEGWIAVPVARDATPHDATPHDATPHDATPYDAIPHDAPPERRLLPPDDPVTTRPNVISVEIWGRANVYSLDYDRAISDTVTLGLGISAWQYGRWWSNYTAAVTVIPVYANFYFSQHRDRGFLSAGFDWISVNQVNGYTTPDNFNTNGIAGTVGGGFESRSNDGFIFRLGAFLVVGQSVSFEPALNLGFAF